MVKIKGGPLKTELRSNLALWGHKEIGRSPLTLALWIYIFMKEDSFTIPLIQ